MRHTTEREAELLDVLQEMHPGASRNVLRRMLDSGRVRVDGEVDRRAKRVVSAGQVVEVAPKPKKGNPKLLGVHVLFEDDVVVVAEKPVGMLTIATDRGDRDTLYDRLFERAKDQRRGGRVFVVHRLDRPTSGVVLFAKSEPAKERLQEAFAAREVERVYHVLVEGLVEKDEGTIDVRIARSESLQVYVTPSDKHGMEAVTHWKVLGRGRRDTLLEVTLGTGKRHQIRVHMAHIGHPVVGDREHGAQSDPLKRLGLHAHRLVFPHPVTGEPVRVESRTPKSFRGIISGKTHEELEEAAASGGADDHNAGAKTR